jgi:AcrR family transcriptional regulator
MNATLLTKGQRAIDAQEKQQRRDAILDAAERLFIQHPERLPNVAEVAQAAKLAKGTVYLYFASKEELLLALHGRHVQLFFRELSTLVERSHTLTLEDMLMLTREHIVGPPAFLPLAALCMGVMEKEVSPEVRNRFFFEIADLLARGGAAIERHFPALPRGGGGAQLLNQSYALIIGLWQMMQPGCVPPEARMRPGMEIYAHGYAEEVDFALRALWNGYLQQTAAHTAAASVSQQSSRNTPEEAKRSSVSTPAPSAKQTARKAPPQRRKS